MYNVGGDGWKPTNTAYTNAKWFLCVGVCVCALLGTPARVWELNHIYLHVAEADYRLKKY